MSTIRACTKEFDELFPESQILRRHHVREALIAEFFNDATYSFTENLTEAMIIDRLRLMSAVEILRIKGVGITGLAKIDAVLRGVGLTIRPKGVSVASWLMECYPNGLNTVPAELYSTIWKLDWFINALIEISAKVYGPRLSIGDLLVEGLISDANNQFLSQSWRIISAEDNDSCFKGLELIKSYIQKWTKDNDEALTAWLQIGRLVST